MAPKVFVTGTTGYIGGDAFYALYNAHPDYEYTAIVRNPDKGAIVAAEYPKTRLVYGTLDNAALLEEESSKADIVLHTADADHEGAARAIAKGLAAGHTAEKPGYWLHTSGTGILCWKDLETNNFGNPPSQPPYNDLDGVSDLTSLPDTAWHRNVDKIVLASNSNAVKTAIVAPPTIYGPGRGPGNKRSQQVYQLALATLKTGQAPQLGKGLTEWDNVHVHDLSVIFLRLAEAAVTNKREIESEIWGQKGYFLAEHGHHVWGEVSKQIGEVAFQKGYIKTKEVKIVTADEAKEIGGGGALTWGLNSKGYAKRARKFLGWTPKGKSLKDEIPDIVDLEASSLGLKVGYAKKASGARQ